MTDVSIGDEVYALTSFRRDGAARGTCRGRIAADPAPKPKTLNLVQAAAVPLSALTAWQAFFEHARLAPGQRVLIHGAAGGSGACGSDCPLARCVRDRHRVGWRTATFCSTLGRMRSLTHQHVRFEEVVRDMDVVLDTIGGGTRERSWQVLKLRRNPGQFAGADPRVRKPAAHGKGSKRGVFFIVRPDREQLEPDRGVDRFRRSPAR